MEHYSSPWANNSTPSHYHYHPTAKHTKSLDSTTTNYFQSCALSSSSKFSTKFGVSSKSTSNVARSLFGPSDPRESKRIQKEEFASQRYADRSRWNFDFQTEKPTAGRYDWSKVRTGTKQRHASGDSSSSSWSSLSKKFQGMF